MSKCECAMAVVYRFEVSMSHCQSNGYAKSLNFRYDVHNEQLKSSEVKSSTSIDRTRELLKWYEHAFHRSVLRTAVSVQIQSSRSGLPRGLAGL